MRKTALRGDWLTMVCGVAILATVGSHALAEDAEPPEVARAMKFLESNGAIICRCAHPDYGQYKGADFDGRRISKSGFVLRYTFKIESTFFSRTTTLDFHFTANGKFDKCNPIRTTAGDDAFTLSSGYLKDVQAYFTKSVSSDEVKRAIGNANFKGICEIMLKYAE